MKVGVIWDKPVVFTKLLEDCGIECELVLPALLAAPFFKRSYNAVVIPSGFANPAYSRVLPALRAISTRLKRFIEKGGVLLVFGGGDDRPDAYNWLPIEVKFNFKYQEDYEIPPVISKDNKFVEILGEFDKPAFDGTLLPKEGNIHMTLNEEVVLWSYPLGKGIIIVTTLHEYPSRKFLTEFCNTESEVLL